MKYALLTITLGFVLSACQDAPETSKSDMTGVKIAQAIKLESSVYITDGHWITNNNFCNNTLDPSDMLQLRFKGNDARKITSEVEIAFVSKAIHEEKLECLKISIDELNIVELDDHGKTYKLAVTNDKRAMLKLNKESFDLLTQYDIEKIKGMTFIDPFKDEVAPYEVKLSM